MKKIIYLTIFAIFYTGCANKINSANYSLISTNKFTPKNTHYVSGEFCPDSISKTGHDKAIKAALMNAKVNGEKADALANITFENEVGLFEIDCLKAAGIPVKLRIVI